MTSIPLSDAEIPDPSASSRHPQPPGKVAILPKRVPPMLPAIAESPTAMAGGVRIGVIDIGSNSIRLVVYDGLTRSPTPIYNEKVLCGLGRDISRTGRLHPGGVAMALTNLARFTSLVQGMEVAAVDVLATAAVREAADGDSFVAEVARRCALKVTVISGEEEARLSGMGVVSGNPGAEGVMGDLGGGSLELVGLGQGVIDRQTTLPLGALRLIGGKAWRKNADQKIAELLDREDWIDQFHGKSFYPVGGNWRSLAKLDMARRGHPIHIIHQYSINGSEMTDLARLVSRLGKSSMSTLEGVSRRRVETLPVSAMVMLGILARLKPKRVVFSALGLREGHLFDLLLPGKRGYDPLIAGCEAMARRFERFGDGDVLWRWTQPLFNDDTGRLLDRLRHAACLLSDMCWTEHPDYRAEHAFLRALRLPIVGMDHSERAFLALSLYIRYGGKPTDPLASPSGGILSPDLRAKAVMLGQALRLAHTVSGGVMALVEKTCLELTSDTIVLWLPDGGGALGGDAVQRRLEALASGLSVVGRVAVSKTDPASPLGG